MGSKSDSYVELTLAFTERIRELRELLMLRTDSSRSVQDVLEDVHSQLSIVENAMADLEFWVQKESKFIQEAKKLQRLVQQQGEAMNHVRNHRPNNLPGPKPGPMVHPSLTLEGGEDEANEGAEEEYDEQEPECNSNERRREHGQSKSSSSTERRGGDGSNTRSTTATNRKQQRGSNVHASSATAQQQPQQQRRRVQGPKYVVPTIPHITKEELDATPKYMKGRATVAKVNAAIDDIQALVAKKYRLLSMPANKVGSRNLKKYQGFVDLQRQCTDKEDNIFFTEEDLREAANLRLDTTGKSILAVLRHLGRLKEKGGRTKRFTLMPVQPLSDVTNTPL